MGAARKLITFGGELSLCEPARRIVEPAPAEIVALNPRRPTGGRSRGRAGGIEGAPRNPTTIVTSVPIVEWWRADLGVTTGATLNWVGQKNGTVATQGTVAAQPTYSAADVNFNNRPSFTFDGVNDELTVALACPAPGTTPRTYWFVFRTLTWVNNTAMFSGTGGTSHVIYHNTASPQIAMFNAVNGANNSGASAPSGPAKRGRVTFTNALDGIVIGSSTTGFGGSTGNNSAASWVIGSFGGAGFCNYALCEILITTGAPSAGELVALDAYATILYGSGVLT